MAVRGSVNMLDTIRQVWGWTGVDPVAVMAVNGFGNVVVRSVDHTFWRICPEELSCKVVARSTGEWEATWADAAFQNDWQMTRLVEIAAAEVGPVGDDRCYRLKVPAALGGKYAPANLGANSRDELIASSGNLARQVRDLPDGAQVRLTIGR